MGPAIAVLALPNLQWTSAVQPLHQRFDSMGASDAPNPTSDQFTTITMVGGLCSDRDREEGSFSCAGTVAYLLDKWVTSYSAFLGVGGTNDVTLTYQLEVSFAVNQSSSGGQTIYWTPSRLALTDFGLDFVAVQSAVAGTSEGVDLPKTYSDSTQNLNKSMQANVIRNGPIIGGATAMWAGNWYQYTPWTIQVDPDRRIRCYPNYTSASCDDCYTFDQEQYIPDDVYYTKCIQVGPGWGGTTNNASFTIPRAGHGFKNDTSLTDIAVDIYSSHRAAFLPHGSLSWLPTDCLQPGNRHPKSRCDWDRLFTADDASPLAHKSTYLNTWEYRVSNNSQADYQTIDFVALLNFTDYQLDPSPITNPQTSIRTPNLKENGTPISVHPWWALAAFAADANGSLPLNRSVASVLADSMYAFYDDGYPDNLLDSDLAIKRRASTLVPLWQMLSMLPYSIKESSDMASDPLHPDLQRTIQMYGWSYGINSRTSYLGAAVAIAGVLVCIIQLIAGLIDLRPYRSLTQILVAALEHAPTSEFTAADTGQKEPAKVYFNVKDTKFGAGKLEFSRRPRG